MKKLLSLAGIALLFSFSFPVETLTEKERKFASSHLENTHAELMKSVKGLSDAQLNFKPAADKWSVKECAFHLTMAEASLRQWVESALKAPANPEKRSEIKMSDDQVIAGLSSRENKVKTYDFLEPRNGKWANADEAMITLEKDRTSLIDFVKNTDKDLRNHVAMETPLGPLDTYQLVLFISSHTTRHMKQIDEVKADPNFPKN